MPFVRVAEAKQSKLPRLPEFTSTSSKTTMPLFPSKPKGEFVPKNTSELFDSLPRDKQAFKYLWKHQGQVLADYETAHLSTKDVALELPTGSGKTLVGLLLGEFRRRRDAWRCAYLCPTKQLCFQVANQAEKYGIECQVLTGKQAQWSNAAFSKYERAKSIAITTYSAIFNSNPKLDDAQMIICDDAHAGQTYVGDVFTLTIHRQEQSGLFEMLLKLFAADVHPSLRASMGSRGKRQVDLIPLPRVEGRFHTMREYLNDWSSRVEDEVRFKWPILRDHLHACNLYVSSSAFQLQPIVPPALMHPAFANAEQRVYMSATLGEGGDLQRQFGIPHIVKIRAPELSANTGRRLVLFPDLASDDDVPGAASIVGSAILSGRALVLTESGELAKQYRETIRSHGGTALGPEDIETSLSPFTDADDAALVLANRFDGIDLPDDTCRKMVLAGLPGGHDLHEQFLRDRLNAFAVLRNRIRVRITQAAGRCTRSAGDFALCLFHGPELLKWCSNKTNTRGLHPDLQAEIDFGIDTSEGKGKAEFRAAMEAFLAQSSEWQAAEEELSSRKATATKHLDDDAVALSAAAAGEVAYEYALWKGDFPKAFESAAGVLGKLEGGRPLKPYRAWWHYLAACAAFLQYRATSSPQWQRSFEEELGNATAMVGVRWLAALRNLVADTSYPGAEHDVVDGDVLWELLSELQVVGATYEATLVGALRNLIPGPNTVAFEDALALLGRALSFRTTRFEESGAPDGLWMMLDGTAVIFEAKTGKKSQAPIAYDDVRQAKSHRDWLLAREIIRDDTPVTTIIIANRDAVHPDAAQDVQSLYYLEPRTCVELLEQAKAILDPVRLQARAMEEELVVDLASGQYRTAGLTQDAIHARLTARRCTSLSLAPN
jgi:hypothetical protein